MISSGLGGGGTKFMDPLLLRRHQQSQEGLQVKMPMPKPVGKVLIGQLVAFFMGRSGGGHRLAGWEKGMFFEVGWMEECKGRLLG